MTPRQVALIRGRLESIGFRTNRKMTLRATKEGVTIVVDPSGLCWSNYDPSDAIAPVLPDILSCDKTRVSLRALQHAYFASERRGDEVLVRLSPRLEFGSRWDELRAGGSCALTPDEQVVYSVLFSSSRTRSSWLTDFPTEGCVARRIGRKQYYDSDLEASEAASTLRTFVTNGTRNTYLPKDSLVRFPSFSLPQEKARSLFGKLGEWCFLSID